MLGLLARHKADLLALLRQATEPPTGDELARFDERAAIAEYDGGQQRTHAELLAALETAPLGPEHNRTAIIEAVALHLDRLATAGIVKH